MHLEESSLRTADGLRLHVRLARPAISEIGVVTLVHGLGEHSGRYPHVMAHLAGHGFAVIAFDLRGHGRSEGERGRLLRYEDYLDDLALIQKSFAAGSRSRFLYGHSLGGQLVINFLARSAAGIDGAVLSSPWLNLAFRPPAWKLALAVIANYLWPDFIQQGPHLEANLSRDAKWLESLREPGMGHRRISARMFAHLTRGAREAAAAAATLNLPLLVMHGDDDPITCNLATRRFFDQLVSDDKTLKLWPGMRHETHNELEREAVLETVTGWLSNHAAGATR